MLIFANPSAAMIPQETIEQVAAASDIVEVIGSYVPLKRAGATFKARCPFHQEKSPSFNVNPARQMFKCFGCGVGGSVFKFVTMFTNIDFPSAVRMLAERAGIPIIEEFSGRSDEEQGAGKMRRQLIKLHAEAAEWFHRNLMKSPGAAQARDYLKTRGLTGEIAARWKLGYAPDSWDQLMRWAAEGGYRRDELVQSGLVKARDEDEGGTGQGGAYDRFRDRLMFPISNEVGEVIAFSGRILKEDAKGAKYVNSPESPIFTKGKVLFGLHMAKRALLDKKFAIVCEGQIDLITAFEAGIQNVTAPQGTAFTEQQARLLKRHADEVVLCFDADNAGQQAAEKSLPALLEANVTVRVATMPAGEDPDSLIRNQGAEAFSERITAAKDFFDFQIERLSKTFDVDTPRGKTQFCRKLAESVALLTDNVLREAVVAKVSARIGVSPQDFRALLRKNSSAYQRRGAVDLRGSGSEEPEPEAAAPARFEPPPKMIGSLLKVALGDEEARQWLFEQPWEEVLHKIEGGELLARVMAAECSVATPASVTTFLANLPPDEEAYLTGLLMEKPVPRPLAEAQGGWLGLEEKLLRERLTTVAGQLSLPNLSPETIALLQREFMQLKLKEIEITAKKDPRRVSAVVERNP